MLNPMLRAFPRTPGPVLRGELSSAAAASLVGVYDVYKAGTTAFVTTQQRGSLVAIDVSNKASPSFISESPRHFTTDNRQLLVSGSLAYVSNASNKALLIYNISNPAAITETGSLINATNLNSLIGIAKDGNTIYGAAQTSGKLNAINVATPAAPASLGTLAMTAPRCVAVYAAGTIAIVASQTGNYVSSVNISNPAAMSVISTVAIPGAAWILTDAANGLIYVASRVVQPQGLYTLSVAADGTLTLIHVLRGVAAGQSLLRKGKSLFTTYFPDNQFAHSALGVVSLANPRAPALAWSGPHNIVEARGLYIDPADLNTLYVTNDTGGKLQIYDIGTVKS